MEGNQEHLEAAAIKAFRLNAEMTKQNLMKPTDGNEEKREKYEIEFVINDLPSEVKKEIITRGVIENQIHYYSGAHVSSKGHYVNPYQKTKLAAGDRPLYLHIHGPNKQSLVLAIQAIENYVKQANVERNTSLAPAIPPPPLVVEKVFVLMENTPKSFNLRERLIGPGGSNLQYIATESGTQVTLCGVGSEFLELSTGRESQEPLHFRIVHWQPVLIETAKNLVLHLLRTIQEDFEKLYPPLQKFPPQPNLSIPPPEPFPKLQNCLPKSVKPGCIPWPPPVTVPPPGVHKKVSDEAGAKDYRCDENWVKDHVANTDVPISVSMGLSKDGENIIQVKENYSNVGLTQVRYYSKKEDPLNKIQLSGAYNEIQSNQGVCCVNYMNKQPVSQSLCSQRNAVHSSNEAQNQVTPAFSYSVLQSTANELSQKRPISTSNEEQYPNKYHCTSQQQSYGLVRTQYSNGNSYPSNINEVKNSDLSNPQHPSLSSEKMSSKKFVTLSVEVLIDLAYGKRRGGRKHNKIREAWVRRVLGDAYEEFTQGLKKKILENTKKNEEKKDLNGSSEEDSESNDVEEKTCQSSSSITDNKPLEVPNTSFTPRAAQKKGRRRRYGRRKQRTKTNVIDNSLLVDSNTYYQPFGNVHKNI